MPRKAEATPYRDSTTINTQMFGANGTAMMDTAAVPPRIMAGRRPVSVEASGRADGDGLGHRGDGERDAGPRGRACSSSTTRTGTSDDRTPNEVQP